MRLGGERRAGNHTFHHSIIKTAFNDPEHQCRNPRGLGSQLCYTNPVLVSQVAQMARDFFDGKGELPEGWKAMGDYFALVPDDNISLCTCAVCRELLRNREDRKTGFFSSGEMSDYWFSFVNAVAREVRKTRPDKYTATLAYWRATARWHVPHRQPQRQDLPRWADRVLHHSRPLGGCRAAAGRSQGGQRVGYGHLHTACGSGAWSWDGVITHCHCRAYGGTNGQSTRVSLCQGMNLHDVQDNGTNPADVEKVSEKKSQKWSGHIYSESLRRSTATTNGSHQDHGRL